jgi:hypothetical protein
MSISASKMNFGAALRKDMFKRQDTEDMIVAAVSKDGMQLQHVQKQTPRIVYAALRQNWRALPYVAELNNFVARQVVLWDPKAASLLPKEYHLLAVISDIHCFDYIAKPSMDACRYVIEQNPDWIAKRPNPPMELCLLAVQVRHKNAQFMVRCERGYGSPYMHLGKDYFKGMRVSKELARASLHATQGYSYISFPEDLKVSLAEETLRVNTDLARFMTLTPALEDVVLSLDGTLIRVLENPTEKQKILACKTTPHAIQYIKNPSRATVWESAAGWQDALKYATEQDEDLCAHAVRNFPAALRHCKTDRLNIWLKAGAPSTVDVALLFPKYAKATQAHILTYYFFRNIADSLRQNRNMPVPADLEDPVSLEPVAKGAVVAMMGDHFVGTLPTLLKMVETRFRGSNYNYIFVPIKNQLVSTGTLRWCTA